MKPCSLANLPPEAPDLSKAGPLSAEPSAIKQVTQRLRKLIRCKVTKTFLTRKGTWTDDIQNAQDFAKYTEAKAAKQDLGLEKVELYYSFDTYQPSEYDFPLSMP